MARITSMRRNVLCVLALMSVPIGASAQAIDPFATSYPPGTFTIDGIPVSCGRLVTIVQSGLKDLARTDLAGHIFMDRERVARLPTVLKLWAYAHECGHNHSGANETDADCWAIRNGKQQGWFTPSNFDALEALFQNNSGDLYHPPGPTRVAQMRTCFGLTARKPIDKPKPPPTGDFCRDLNRIADDAPDNFRRLKGEYRKAGSWSSLVTLSGNSPVCLISQDKPEGRTDFYCGFLETSARELLDKAGKCLDRAKWQDWNGRGFATQQSPRTLIEIETSSNGRGANLRVIPPLRKASR